MVQDPKARNFVCFMGTRNPWTGRAVECSRASDRRRLLQVLLLNFIQIEPGWWWWRCNWSCLISAATSSAGHAIGMCWHSIRIHVNFNRPMTILAQTKKNYIKRYDNSTALVFLWDKTTPTPYKIRGMWPIEFPFIQPLLQPFYPPLQPPWCSSLIRRSRMEP